jgi:hypothetical protein
MSNLPVFLGTTLTNQPERTAAISLKAHKSKEFEVFQQEFFPNQTLKANEAFALVSSEPEEHQFDAEGIVLVSEDQKVVVTYIEGDRAGKPFKLVNALVIAEVGGSEVIRSFEVDEHQQVSFVAENVFEGDVKKEFIDNLENPLFPETHDEVEGQSQAFFSGCLWGGYRWCGKGCYNYPEIGGDGSWINSTDYCCMAHDYCYKNGYVSRSKCNDNFCDCLKGQTNTAANMAKGYYCVF